VVEPSPKVGHHKEFSRHLSSYETDLVFPQFRDDGVLHGAQAGERCDDDQVSSVVGSCQDTTVPARIPPSANAAAVAHAAS
jgi:hypothetical protein